MFKINFKAPNIKLFDPVKAEQMMNREGMITMNTSLIKMQNSVVSLTPKGATLRLIGSIKTSIKQMKNKLLGLIFSGVKYAMTIEKGRKASPVSELGQRSLAQWIRQSSGGRAWFSSLKSKYPKITLRSAVFLLARSLKRKKRIGKKFFEKGIKNVKIEVMGLFQKYHALLAKEFMSQ